MQKKAFDVRSAGIGVQHRDNLHHTIGDLRDAQQIRIYGFGKPIMMPRPKRDMSDYVAKYVRYGRAHI
jgi:hypothetical protein